MKVKVINKSENSLPQYATPLSAGMDVRAANEQPIRIDPLQGAMGRDMRCRCVHAAGLPPKKESRC